MAKPSGDASFRSIYDSYHADVLSYCLRRTSAEDSKDATADVFLIVWRRLDDLPDPDRTLPWLYGTARKVLANQRRSRSRLMHLRYRLRLSQSLNVTAPEITVVRREQDREVLDALERLRPQDREVIRLTMWEELSQSAIGDVLGCSHRAVTMRLHRALRQLRRELAMNTEMPRAPALARETEATDG